MAIDCDSRPNSVCLLFVTAPVILSLPWVAPGAPRWIEFLLWLVWAYVMLSTLPQYCELRPGGLFIRQGVRKALIPYSSWVQVLPHTETQSAGVYSLEGIQVVTASQGNFTIAPRDRFLEELSRRTPPVEA